MRKFNLTEFNTEYLDELKEIAKENPSLTFGDALELLAKKHADAVNDIGTMHDDGRFTKSEITMEGIETKELDLGEELNKLKKQPDLDK